MYGKYFVLISEEFFGFFAMDAKSYPQEFEDNFDCVHIVEYSELYEFLLEKLGRNILISKKIDMSCVGRVFSRKVG